MTRALAAVAALPAPAGCTPKAPGGKPVAADGRVTGRTGCNRMSGMYQADAKSLTFSHDGGTFTFRRVT